MSVTLNRIRTASGSIFRAGAYDLVSRALGLVLLAAAVLKGYELATGPVVEDGLYTSRWFWTVIVEFQLVFGIWLLVGLYPKRTRLLAIAWWLALLEVSLYQVAAGRPTCACFGRLHMSPWYTAALNLIAVTALLCSRAAALEQRTAFSCPWRFCAVLFAIALVGIPGAKALTARRATDIPGYLRRDPALQGHVTLHLENGLVPDVLSSLAEQTGLTFTLEDSLQPGQAPTGSLQLERVRVCSVLELLARRQPVEAHWKNAGSHYRLVPKSAWLRVDNLWMFSLAGLLLC